LRSGLLLDRGWGWFLLHGGRLLFDRLYWSLFDRLFLSLLLRNFGWCWLFIKRLLFLFLRLYVLC
jgi:hypothetical protein